MQFIPGAPNAINIKALKKTAEGKFSVLIEVNNQEEELVMADFIPEQSMEIIKSNLGNAFAIILPNLVNKIISQ